MNGVELTDKERIKKALIGLIVNACEEPLSVPTEVIAVLPELIDRLISL